MSEFISKLFNALTYGGTVAIIGILVVFAGLIILIAIVWFMAKILNRLNADAEARKQAAEAAAARAAAEAAAKAAAAAVPAPAPVQETVAEEVTDDAELIAVIAAALAAFDNTGKTLVVRKVRRVSAWNKSSREEQVCRF